MVELFGTNRIMGKRGINWHLQTSTPGRMSSIVLPAVITGKGKSMIPKPGPTGLLSHGRQPV